jgi:hypothetical protein
MLRGCVLTFEDRGQHFGYYRQNGFVGRDGGERRDEICLNPRYFLTNTGDLELLQTLVHEQTHQWQTQFGKPSLRTYHNRQWANKMLAIGLTPSSTGKPGGAQTGQHMADYPTEGGLFLKIASEILEKSSLISWYKEGVAIKRAQEYAICPNDTNGPESPPFIASMLANLPSAQEPIKTPSKLCYQCPECGMKVWGKPALKILCGECGKPEQAVPLLAIASY